MGIKRDRCLVTPERFENVTEGMKSNPNDADSSYGTGAWDRLEARTV